MSEEYLHALLRLTTPAVLEGEEIVLGWNGAKLFADRGELSGRRVRVQKVGRDWVVIRYEGRAYAYAFSLEELDLPMRKLLED